MKGIPDFFWEEDRYAGEYDIASKYFEVDLRIDILNKRLALLKQLIVVVNMQRTNLHGQYRMTVIIWCIVVYAVLEALSPLLIGYLI